jgi:DNA polymerase III alpha subunit (gram-positive type)
MAEKQAQINAARKERRDQKADNMRKVTQQLNVLQESIGRDVDYLCILDFESTCKAPSPQEIIKFPTLLLNLQSGEIESTCHHYIKPDVHPTLSAFCTDLTGIEQATVDHGISLEGALQLHQDWLN